MKTQQQKIGKKGEDLAVKFLKKKSYKIIERNFRAGKYGEIDIIAKDKDELVFVEVKTKTNKMLLHDIKMLNKYYDDKSVDNRKNIDAIYEIANTINHVIENINNDVMIKNTL